MSSANLLRLVPETLEQLVAVLLPKSKDKARTHDAHSSEETQSLAGLRASVRRSHQLIPTSSSFYRAVEVVRYLRTDTQLHITAGMVDLGVLTVQTELVDRVLPQFFVETLRLDVVLQCSAPVRIKAVHSKFEMA